MSSSVVARVAGLGALTAAGQLLIIGSLPAYSRIFDPDTYGEYVIYVGLYTVFSVLAGVRYNSAIVLPRNDGMAAALSSLVISIALAVSALIVAATLAAGYLGWVPARWSPVAGTVGIGLAAATAVGGLQRCLTAWCIRRRRFLSIGMGQFVFCLVSIVAQLSLSRALSQLPALVWGYCVALTLQTACLAGAAPKSLPRMTARAMRLAARKYRRFPTYMVGYAFASSVRDRLVQLALGIGAGAAAVGRFGLAYRVMFAPNSLVYSAVSPVFYSIASRGSKPAVGIFAAGLVDAAFAFLIVPYAAFAIEAPTLTDAVLSEKWRGTGPYLQALAAPALLLTATCWLDRAFDSFRRQRVAFTLEVSFTVVSVAAVGCLARLLEPVAVAWAFGSLALLYYWIYFFTTFVACGFPLGDFRRASRNAVLLVCMGLGGAFLDHQAGGLALRAGSYGLTMAVIISIWIKYLGGADTMRILMRSQLGDEQLQGMI